jgi:hypothetical protein
MANNEKEMQELKVRLQLTEINEGLADAYNFVGLKNEPIVIKQENGEKYLAIASGEDNNILAPESLKLKEYPYGTYESGFSITKKEDV